MSAAKKLGPCAEDLVSGFKHIVMRDGYMGGKPALMERRISVSQILEALAGGMTMQEIWNMYKVSEDSVLEVLKYAAEVTGTRKCG